MQNFSAGTTVTTLAGGTQTITGGPVASQEAIKELGTNGGGFYNANSAHPFENPTALTNLLEIFLLLLIPFCLTRTFGRMVRDQRQGYAILGGDGAPLGAASWLGDLGLEVAAPRHGAPARRRLDGGQGDPLRGGRLGAVRGVDDRRRRPARSTPSTPRSPRSAAAWRSFNMGLGEVAPGGVGSGLYGMLVLAVVTVFIAGLMVGRTPEYLRQEDRRPRDQARLALHPDHAGRSCWSAPASRWRLPGPRASMLNPGPHGLSEVLYAFTSAGNNNGSAFAGLAANTAFYNTALGLAMLLGRFLPDRLRAGPGRLARRSSSRCRRPRARCPPTGRCSSGCSSASSLIVAGLTFFPALALGPLAEGLLIR